MSGSWQVIAYGFVIFAGLLWVRGKADEACSFPAIYNFGDSNSDTGARSAAIAFMDLPYGQTFFHKQSARFSDGRIMIDFFAEELKLPYLNAYLDSLGVNFRHGANFAIGSATVRKPNKTTGPVDMSPIHLKVQIMQFKQFKRRTAELYAEAKDPCEKDKLPIQEEFSKALYTFDIGQNDLTAAYWASEIDEPYQVTLSSVVDQFASAVKEVYDEGGRYFWIHNTGPQGCYPINIAFSVLNLTKDDFDSDSCIKFYNEHAIEFNQMLKDRVIKLRTELPEAVITHVDVHTAKNKLVREALKLGFDDPMKICCGHHVGNAHIFCFFPGVKPCEHPETTISWDGIHFTESANKWVAEQIINGSLSDPPIPISQACHSQ